MPHANGGHAAKAAPARPGRRFLLSIHDVWPGNFDVVDGHCRILRRFGARHIALLVVPAYHGKRAVEAAPDFLAWLREKESEGSEILLHGYHHLMLERLSAPGSVRRSAWGRWVNRKLVGDEAEFCGLPEADRVRLLDLGMESMAKAGLSASGFVAPTWHGAPPKPALQAQGLDLWEGRFLLHHLPSGASRFIPPLAWDAPGKDARLMGGKPWLAALSSLPFIKVALHPGDLESPSALRVVESVFAGSLETAYADAFA
jgi:predicted deacetylase